LLERNTPPQSENARITGIDRKTIHSHHSRWLADSSNSPVVATGLKKSRKSHTITVISVIE
jgi:hypothetical protein